jgi:hypothetical protein
MARGAATNNVHAIICCAYSSSIRCGFDSRMAP